MKDMERKMIEETIAASLVFCFGGKPESFKAELSELRPDDFSVPEFRDIFERFMAGTLAQHAIPVGSYKRFEKAWTHAGHIRWYMLELIGASRRKTA